MSLNPITDSEFNTSIEAATTPVLVDFWAEWCGPCRMLAPILESIANQFEGKLAVYKLNTDENPNTAGEYKITGIPRCLLFKDGKEIARITGFKAEDAFIAELKEHITL